MVLRCSFRHERYCNNPKKEGRVKVIKQNIHNYNNNNNNDPIIVPSFFVMTKFKCIEKSPKQKPTISKAHITSVTKQKKSPATVVVATTATTTTAAAAVSPKSLKSLDKVKVAILCAMTELSWTLNTKNIPTLWVAILSGYSHVRSTGFSKAMSGLIKDDLMIVNATERGHLKFTQLGLCSMPTDVTYPKSNREVHQRLLAILHHKVTGKVSDRLDTIWTILCDGKVHDIQDLLVASGYNHARSTGFTKILSTLKELHLAEKIGSKQLKLSSIAFPFPKTE